MVGSPCSPRDSQESAHSSKAPILRLSAFFTVQLSHPYMTTGKIITLARQTFVGKVTSLLLNILSRMVITFLSKTPRLFLDGMTMSDYFSFLLSLVSIIFLYQNKDDFSNG